jgi:predicted TPR repeat methyltransferase
MSRRATTIAPDYFEQLYAQDGDPWKFATSAYEAEKYARTLAALPELRYRNALEVGCSIGVLTSLLAPRCERLLALDAAAAPLVEARRRCEVHANVAFARAFVPREWPQGEFDLILLSEVVYYLDAKDVGGLATKAAGSLAPGGTIALVHWTGETNYPLTGDEAAEMFIASLTDLVEIVEAQRFPGYRLDVLKRR